MKKIISFIKKNYIYVNITFLLLSIYIILFPILAIPIKAVFPQFNECTYLRITNKECPLCGGTRYIRNLPKAISDITYLFHPFGIMIIFIVFEGFFRLYHIITRKKEKTEKQIEIDILCHLLVSICFFLYEILFLYGNVFVKNL